MASKTRASSVSPFGRRRSIVCSTDEATKESAASKSRCDDRGMYGRTLVQVCGLGTDGAVRRENDLLDLHLGLGKLLFAVLLEQGAALVGRNRLVELHLAALELLDDAFQLLQRVLE